MFTPTTDYNQQMFAYLQYWQQLLQQWTTMAAGLSSPAAPSAMPLMPLMPFMPPIPQMPSMPPMPPSAPTSSVPGDYTQQLMSSLQQWRQYLERMAAGQPGVPPPTTPPANATGTGANAGGSGQAPTVPPQDPIKPPRKPDLSRNPLGVLVSNGSTPPPWPPNSDKTTYKLDLSQNPTDTPADIPGVQLIKRTEVLPSPRPDYSAVGDPGKLAELSAYSYAQPLVGSAHLDLISRVTHDPTAQPEMKSHFSIGDIPSP